MSPLSVGRMLLLVGGVFMLLGTSNAALATPGALPPLARGAAHGAWYAIFGTQVYRLDILESGGAVLVLADPSAGTETYHAQVFEVDDGRVRATLSGRSDSIHISGTAKGWRFKTRSGVDITGDMDLTLVFTFQGRQSPPRALAFWRRNFSVPKAIIHAEALADRAAKAALREVDKPRSKSPRTPPETPGRP